MDQTKDLKTTLERASRALEIRPALGKKTATTTARVGEGVRCDIEEGRWKLVSDLSEKGGGTGAGPDPSLMVRAAFVSCLAMGYRMWAARLGVAIDDIEVKVDADFDLRGQYGDDSVDAGYSEVRYTVTVSSNAEREDIERVLDATEANSPLIDIFTRPQPLSRKLTVNPKD